MARCALLHSKAVPSTGVCIPRQRSAQCKATAAAHRFRAVLGAAICQSSSESLSRISITSGSVAAAAACCGAGGLLAGGGGSTRLPGAATAAAGRPLPLVSRRGDGCLLGEESASESASESLSARNCLLPAAGRPRLLQGSGSICSSCSRSLSSLESTLEPGEALAAAAASLGSATAPQRSWRLPLLAPNILRAALIATTDAKEAAETAQTDLRLAGATNANFL